MYRLLSIAALIALSVSVPSFADVCGAVPGNLVVNCGFETGSFSGWTQSDNINNTFVAGAFDEGPNSGSRFAALGNVGFNASLSQTLATVIGQSYNISFYFASDGSTPNEFSASFGSDLLYSNENVPAWKAG